MQVVQQKLTALNIAHADREAALALLAELMQRGATADEMAKSVGPGLNQLMGMGVGFNFSTPTAYGGNGQQQQMWGNSGNGGNGGSGSVGNGFRLDEKTSTTEQKKDEHKKN